MIFKILFTVKQPLEGNVSNSSYITASYIISSPSQAMSSIIVTIDVILSFLYFQLDPSTFSCPRLTKLIRWHQDGIY